MNKEEWRRLLREKRRNEENRDEKDTAICKNVLSLPEFSQAHMVFAYNAAFGEPNLADVIEKAVGCGKRVCLPVTYENGELEAVEYRPGNRLKEGKYGIFEPMGKVVPKEEIDLVLCPGVGFDEDFNRLGQGGGYYDRYLENISPICVGICYNDCMTEALPIEEHDRKMNCIITEENIWRTT